MSDARDHTEAAAPTDAASAVGDGSGTASPGAAAADTHPGGGGGGERRERGAEKTDPGQKLLGIGKYLREVAGRQRRAFEEEAAPSFPTSQQPSESCADGSGTGSDTPRRSLSILSLRESGRRIIDDRSMAKLAIAAMADFQNVTAAVTKTKEKPPSNDIDDGSDGSVKVSGGSAQRQAAAADSVPTSPGSCRSESDAETRGEEDPARGVLARIAKPVPARETSHEFPHEFREHTYAAPTYCDICGGLLVGFWSQGLQCRRCGLNAHRGEGVGDHDDCRLEALLKPCEGSGHPRQPEAPVGVGDALRQMRALARDSPDLLQEVRQQMDRDLRAHVEGNIVRTGVEKERTRKFRRLREAIEPILRAVDGAESRGEVRALLVLLAGHAALAAGTAAASLAGLVLAHGPRHGLLSAPAWRCAAAHAASVVAAMHVSLVLLALGLRRAAGAFNRKSIVLDRVLREMFEIDAERDLGVSVAGAAARARAWCGRALKSSLLSMALVGIAWYFVQPLPRDLSGSNESRYDLEL